MANLKSRIGQEEERQWQDSVRQLVADCKGRSEDDVMFFCAHGYLPEVSTPGPPVDTSAWNWTLAETKRLLAGRSLEDKEFFCVNGYWPGERISE